MITGSGAGRYMKTSPITTLSGSRALSIPVCLMTVPPAAARGERREVLPPHIGWSGKYDRYDGRYSTMEYILVRGDLSPKTRAQMQGFTEIGQVGPWTLYENVHTLAAGGSVKRN